MLTNEHFRLSYFFKYESRDQGTPCRKGTGWLLEAAE
jgi:NADH:ubiquinone oxidoreductase subunit F (NADH-binding)